MLEAPTNRGLALYQRPPERDETLLLTILIGVQRYNERFWFEGPSVKKFVGFVLTQVVSCEGRGPIIREVCHAEQTRSQGPGKGSRNKMSKIKTDLGN